MILTEIQEFGLFQSSFTVPDKKPKDKRLGKETKRRDRVYASLPSAHLPPSFLKERFGLGKQVGGKATLPGTAGLPLLFLLKTTKE